MTELEKIAYAKKFLDDLAAGVNPADGTPVPEGDVARQTRVVGCFRYVSELLDHVIRTGGLRTVPRARRAPFSVTPEQLMKYRFPSEPLTVSRFVQAVNAAADLSRVRNLRVHDVTDWLVAQGYLAEEDAGNGRRHRVPTEKGTELGILTAQKNGPDGLYTSVQYNRNAQTFLLDHMAEIAASIPEERPSRGEAEAEAVTPAE